MTRFDATGSRPVDKWTTRKNEFPTSPQAQQQKRSIDLVHKPVNSVCYRHYLSLVNIRERPPDDETALFEGHHRIPHTWISLLFFALFADNLVRWWEGADSSHWFWLLSGQIEAALIFAGLSVAVLFRYRSRIGHIFDGSE